MRVRLLTGAVVAVVVIAGYLFLRPTWNGYRLRVVMADAGGLQSGSNVSVNGVTVGRVASLTVNKQDHAVAVVHLGSSAAPLGSGATAEVGIDGFFGERELLLTRGDYRNHPERSGFTIPMQDATVSVRIDDVVDALDMDAQGALKTFLDEQGEALVGRGQNLAQTLQALPQTLGSLTPLLSQFSANTQALGQLVERSDQVIGEVAAQRSGLGQMVNSANGAFSALASRRTQLGQTVQTAPGTLDQARATLATLQGTAIPLAPAADGLRATAPSLTTALHQIPKFANAAVPTLNKIAVVAPYLERLAVQGTPVVRDLTPLTSELTTYTQQALRPILTMLDANAGAANLFGVMEGWARSTSGYDASSHIFRFGATVGPSTFAQLLADLNTGGLAALHRHTNTKSSSTGRTTPSSTPAASPTPAAAAGAGSALSNPLADVGAVIGGTVSKTLGAVGGLKAITGALGAGAGATADKTGASVGALLGYLLKK